MFALVLTLLACGPKGDSVASLPKGGEEAPACMVTWAMNKHASVLSEQRNLPGEDWFDFATAYDAATIDATAVPVQVTSAYVVDGKPLLYFTADGSKAVVDEQMFAGPLTAVDLTNLGVDATGARPLVRIGQLTERGRTAIPARTLLEFLVKADVLRTWAHLESTVCLEWEVLGPDGAYTASFRGEHLYFTNEEHHGRLAFEVRVAPDGVIAVQGR